MDCEEEAEREDQARGKIAQFGKIGFCGSDALKPILKTNKRTFLYLRCLPKRRVKTDFSVRFIQVLNSVGNR